MIARELIATAKIAADSDDELRLFQHGNDYIIMIGSNELMNSRVSGSEEALAVLGCGPIADRANANILIGGYGMGFTLRSALQCLRDDAQITVAELVPEILDWARAPMADLTGNGLEDKRTHICLSDVADVIGKAQQSYDSILLDVDNGPDGLTQDENDHLYSDSGLLAAKRALKPGGVLAIWSAHPDPKFTQRLKAVGFDVSEHIVRARSNGKGARHNIWINIK